MTDMFRQVLRGARKTFRRRYLAQAGLLGILVILALALLAPVIAPQDPYDQMQLDIMNGLLPPGSEMMDGSIAYLGTDSLGRDILSAVLYGSRTSLMVAVIAVAIGTSAGVLLGLLSALRGGWIDTIIMRAVDLTVSFPGVLLAIMLLAIFGAGVDKVILALSIGIWAQAARLVRAVGQAEARAALAARARELGYSLDDIAADSARLRSKLPAKYRHPEDPTLTWTGKGRRPRWLHEALDTGMDLEAFSV